MADQKQPLEWLVSWDENSHAFRKLDDVVSEALCTHSARTKTLLRDTGNVPKCYACLVLLGEALEAEGLADARWR